MGRGVRFQLDKQYGDWAWSSENFWRKIERRTDSECWPWLGSMGPAGPLFGAYRIDPFEQRTPQMTQARRILYAEHNRHMLEPKQAVYHSCLNSNCMNPLHQTLQRITKSNRL